MQFSHFFPNAAELTPLPETKKPVVHPVLKKTAVLQLNEKLI